MFFTMERPQPRAYLGTLMFLIHLIIPLPNVFQLVCGTSLACLGDGNANLPIFHGLAEGNGLVRTSIGDGVVHQVINHLGNAQLVGANPNRLSGLEGKVVTGQLVIAGENGSMLSVRLKRDDPGVQRRPLDGKIQQVIDQVCQLLRLIDDDLHIFRRILAGRSRITSL